VLIFNYKTPFSVVRSRYLRNAIRPNGSFSCEYPNLVRSVGIGDVNGPSHLNSYDPNAGGVPGYSEWVVQRTNEIYPIVGISFMGHKL
jgi:hypothetical protein